MATKEKIFWVSDDGLCEVQKYLDDGWRVKMIQATPGIDAMGVIYAYIVLEREY